MNYLVVGLDMSRRTPWHATVRASDWSAAERVALDRARSRGVNLAVAGVIGPHSNMLSGLGFGRAPALAEA